jgi:hypothetical protein
MQIKRKCHLLSDSYLGKTTLPHLKHGGGSLRNGKLWILYPVAIDFYRALLNHPHCIRRTGRQFGLF